MKKLTLFVLFVIGMMTVNAQFPNPRNYEGDGTSRNPFKIYTAEDLDKLRNYCGPTWKSANFTLMNSIDMYDYIYTYYRQNGWVPIGNSQLPFQGIFYGNSNTLYNLIIRKQDQDYVGLFGYIGNKGVVISLKIELHPNFPVLGKNYVGGLAGCIDSSYISDCIVTYGQASNPYGTGINATGENIGGILGYAINSQIFDCQYRAFSVTGKKKVGGCIGSIKNSFVRNCRVNNINASIAGIDTIGGVFGFSDNCKLTNIEFLGAKVEADEAGAGGIIGKSRKDSLINNKMTKGQIKAKRFVGGIIGDAFSSYISNSYSLNSGSIHASDYMGGGLIGHGDSIQIMNSHNYSTISGKNLLGGIIGCLDNSIMTNCTNSGSVTSDTRLIGGILGRDWMKCTVISCSNSGNIRGRSEVGGCVGQIDYNNQFESRYENCFNTGTVTADSMAGGIIGSHQRIATIINCYNQGNVKSLNYDAGGITGRINSICNYKDSYNKGKVEGTNNIGGAFGAIIAWRPPTFENCYNEGTVYGENIVGGFVGYNKAIIKSCYNKGAVHGKNSIGGFVGKNYSPIETSYNEAAVNGQDFVGGFVGENHNQITACNVGGFIDKNNQYTILPKGKVDGHTSTGGFAGANLEIIDNCFFVGDVEGITEDSYNIGGFAGRNLKTIRNCYSNSHVKGTSGVGGFIGLNEANANVSKSYCCGTVSGSSEIGGFIGYNNYGEIDQCFNTSHTCGQFDYIGGFIGYCEEGNIRNCHTHGELIDHPEETWSGGGFIGGIGSFRDLTQILNCYSSTKTLQREWGEFAFQSWDCADIISCFFDYQSAGSVNGDPCNYTDGLSTDEMRYRQPFLAKRWDFENIWGNKEGYKAPFLQWQTVLDGTFPKWAEVAIVPGSPAEDIGIQENIFSWLSCAIHNSCHWWHSPYAAPSAPKSTDNNDLLDINNIKNQTISIYPNPTTDIINISGENLDVRIYDSKGILLIQTKSNTIDLSSYPKGMYLFNINGKVEKILKY